MLHSTNFEFLIEADVKLSQLCASAERYFLEDASTCLIKVRQYAEHLTKLVAARHALYVGQGEGFQDTLCRLCEKRVIPRQIADVLHRLRKLGNAAVHDHHGTHREALYSLRMARQLGVWFYKTYFDSRFAPGPFVPPPPPTDAGQILQDEIEALRVRVQEAEAAAAKARGEAQDHAIARESAEEQLRREEEARAFWHQLLQEEKAQNIELKARLEGISRTHMFARRTSSFERETIEFLVELSSVSSNCRGLQTNAERLTELERRALAERAESVAASLEFE